MSNVTIKKKKKSWKCICEKLLLIRHYFSQTLLQGNLFNTNKYNRFSNTLLFSYKLHFTLEFFLYFHNNTHFN